MNTLLNNCHFVLTFIIYKCVCCILILQGHAPAGGCLLALSCDESIMVKSRATIGLNETLLVSTNDRFFIEKIGFTIFKLIFTFHSLCCVTLSTFIGLFLAAFSAMFCFIKQCSHTH